VQIASLPLIQKEDGFTALQNYLASVPHHATPKALWWKQANVDTRFFSGFWVQTSTQKKAANTCCVSPDAIRFLIAVRYANTAKTLTLQDK
jgi:hypothetical protein